MSPVRSTVTLIGSRLEPDHHRVRDFLTRIAQPYEWLEAGSPAAEAALARLGRGPAELPLLADGDRVLERVTVRCEHVILCASPLAPARHERRKLGLRLRTRSRIGKRRVRQDAFEQGHEAGLGFDYTPGLRHSGS